jgi:hypothetical protein
MKSIAKARRAWRTRLILLTLAIATVGVIDFCTVRYCALNAHHIPAASAQTQPTWMPIPSLPGFLLAVR